MTRMLLVIDSSVLLKLFLKEEDTDIEKVERLYGLILTGEIKVYCPCLLILEMMNVLSKSKRLDKTFLLKVGRSLKKMAIVFESLDMENWQDLVSLINKYNLTAYDGSYLWLATKKKCKLLTADKELLKVKEHCISLKDFKI